MFILAFDFLFNSSSIYQDYISFRMASGFPEIKSMDCQLLNQNKVYAQKDIDIDFETIDPFYTGLSARLNFKDYFEDFLKKYDSETQFRDLVDLYLFVKNLNNPFYENLFLKLSLLHTIFDALVGKPKEIRCNECRKESFSQTWKVFLTNKLSKFGFDEDFCDLLVSIRLKVVNRQARVPFVHRAEQYSSSKELFKEFRDGQFGNYGKNEICELLNKIQVPENKNIEPSSMDWLTIFGIYQKSMKDLIWLHSGSRGVI